MISKKGEREREVEGKGRCRLLWESVFLDLRCARRRSGENGDECEAAVVAVLGGDEHGMGVNRVHCKRNGN